MNGSQRTPRFSVSFELTRKLSCTKSAIECIRVFLYSPMPCSNDENLPSMKSASASPENGADAVERVAAVGAEVVDDVALAVAVVDAKGEVVLAERPARGVDDLEFVAQERVRVAGVDAEVAADVEEPLRRRRRCRRR